MIINFLLKRFYRLMLYDICPRCGLAEKHRLTRRTEIPCYYYTICRCGSAVSGVGSFPPNYLIDYRVKYASTWSKGEQLNYLITHPHHYAYIVSYRNKKYLYFAPSIEDVMLFYRTFVSVANEKPEVSKMKFGELYG